VGAKYANAVNYAVVGDGSAVPEWVGRAIEVQAPYPVEAGRVADYCSLIEDPNPVYWDTGLASRRYGSPVAPPAMLTVWRQASPWHPNGRPAHGPVIAAEVPLPADTLINVGFSSRFLLPIRIGDRLRYFDKVVSVTEEKQTALGRGRFIHSECTVTNQSGEVVAVYKNAMLRYQSGTANNAKRDATGASVSSSHLGEAPISEVPEVVFPVTFTLCTLDTAATRDYFPGHHDPEYARSQGVPGAYPNTGFYCGLVDRVAVEWANFTVSVVSRELTMLKPAEIGQVLHTSGNVIDKRTENDRKVTDLEIRVSTAESLIARAKVSVAELNQKAGA
jgi:acyl dehydratase